MSLGQQSLELPSITVMSVWPNRAAHSCGVQEAETEIQGPGLTFTGWPLGTHQAPAS